MYILEDKLKCIAEGASIRLEASDWPPDWQTGRGSFLSYLIIAAHARHLDLEISKKLIALD